MHIHLGAVVARSSNDFQVAVSGELDKCYARSISKTSLHLNVYSWGLCVR